MRLCRAAEKHHLYVIYKVRLVKAPTSCDTRCLTSHLSELLVRVAQPRTGSGVGRITLFQHLLLCKNQKHTCEIFSRSRCVMIELTEVHALLDQCKEKALWCKNPPCQSIFFYSPRSCLPSFAFTSMSDWKTKNKQHFVNSTFSFVEMGSVSWTSLTQGLLLCERIRDVSEVNAWDNLLGVLHWHTLKSIHILVIELGSIILIFIGLTMSTRSFHSGWRKNKCHELCMSSRCFLKHFKHIFILF